MQIQQIPSIHRRYDQVYVSPHFDDVVASCGGRIHQQINQGKSILIVTVFSASEGIKPQVEHAGMTGALDYELRQREDRMAMQLLACDYLWLEYPEFLFRHKNQWLRYGLRYRDTAANRSLCTKLTKDLNDICQISRCSDLTLPLGVGQHMDHQIVFKAGADMSDTKGRDYTLSYYEELPYALFHFLLHYRLKQIRVRPPSYSRKNRYPGIDQRLSPKEVYGLWSSLPLVSRYSGFIKPWIYLLWILFDLYTRIPMKPPPNSLQSMPTLPETYDITTVIENKIRAILAYTSQLNGLVTPQAHIKQALVLYARSLGLPKGHFGERYWITQSLNSGCQ